MKILCICGSPVKGGNTRVFVEKAVEPISGEAEMEIVELCDKEVADCVHCDWCLKNKDENRICRLKDDGAEILMKVKKADILVLASPVYFGRLTGRLACLIDRMRPLVVSNTHHGCMTDKPGVALALSWYRNGGVETALLSMIYSFLVLEMIPVSCHRAGAFFGGAGLTNLNILPVDPGDKHGIISDEAGIASAQGVMKRALKLHRKLKGSA